MHPAWLKVKAIGPRFQTKVIGARLMVKSGRFWQLTNDARSRFLAMTPTHNGSDKPRIQTLVLGHSLICLLVHSDRLLWCLLCPAHFACALHCANLFAHSLTLSRPSSWENEWLDVLCCSEPQCDSSTFPLHFYTCAGERQGHFLLFFFFFSSLLSSFFHDKKTYLLEIHNQIKSNLIKNLPSFSKFLAMLTGLTTENKRR